MTAANNAIKILLIEDNLGDARLIEIMLRDAGTQPYEVTSTDTFQKGIQHLTEGNFDLVLLDLSLPDSFGLDTITNANHYAPKVPIIVLTGRNDEDFALEVVKEGAQDYLVKGQIDSSLLSRSIRYAMKRKEMEVHLKESNRRIEESESRLNVIISNNTSGLIVLDKQNRIKFTNPAADKMLKKDNENLIGTNFPYDYSFESPALINLETIQNSLVEIVAVETEWAGEHATLITLHDISELKKAEESLRIKNNELTRINKALDRFVYIISHDLKKPTANIIGLLTLYEKELVNSASDRTKVIYDKLNFSALQLKKMIEDLLEATKHEINTEQNYELIDFNKIYQEVLGTMDQMVNQADPEINIDFSKYPFIFYPYQDLKSIMANLFSNAVKYRSPNRRAKITIKTEKKPEGPILTISDNGLGIDLEKESSRLFQKYQRFSNEVEGTGLGLWIVKEIVEKNGGKIEIDSHVDQGTTFRILF
ncbi:MAG: response regulator [Sphingobacteriales bacterium]|nr:MAG: response regulator [Sphingobacteriales bacterium]